MASKSKPLTKKEVLQKGRELGLNEALDVLNKAINKHAAKMLRESAGGDDVERCIEQLSNFLPDWGYGENFRAHFAQHGLDKELYNYVCSWGGHPNHEFSARVVKAAIKKYYRLG